MPDSLKKLRIFAASPSDVTNERAKLETVVDSLKPMADYLGLTFEVVDWRAVVPDAGRPQQIIFDQLKPTSWDIFIGILWHRFGTPPGAKDKTGKDYLSGTEEEFKTAYELWKQHGKPRMVIYRCTRALPFDVDPDQLKNVRVFFKLIEDVKGDYPTLYQVFDTTESFEKLVLDNLQKLLVEYGEESKTPITPEVEQVLAPKIPNNLPRRQAFFGRTKEMETVMRALSPADRTWGVLVDGIGGIGKSAIAIEAAYRAQEAVTFQAFVFVTAKTNILEPSGIKELNPPARTLDEFLNETARILGQPGIAKLTGDEKRRTLIEVLRSMRTLLVYDNLETLSKEEQEGIADFLRELPQGCKAIITSRRRGGEGAVWLRLEKLDWDAARGIIENEIARGTELAEKMNRVGEVQWKELFDDTKGSPLALMHILGLIRVRVALTFDGALEMLRNNRDADLQKFIFQEARKELTENDKTALGALSFFAPSANFAMWLDMTELSRNALETTVDRLSALSLVDILAGEERYALHPLTRTFVHNELLGDENLARETGMRFASYWVDYAQRYGGDINYDTYDRLETEWANLDSAANWLWKTIMSKNRAANNKDAIEKLNSLFASLSNFMWFYGRWDERIKLGVLVYDANRLLSIWYKARTAAGEVAWIYSIYARNLPDEMQVWVDKYVDASAHYSSIGDSGPIKRYRGLLQWQRKDYDGAVRLFKEALSIIRNEMWNTWWGQLFRIISVFSQSLKISIEKDVTYSVIAVLNDLGLVSYECNNWNDAEQYFLEALKLAKEFDIEEGQAFASGNLGDLALNRGLLEDAHRWFEKALLVARRVKRQDDVARAQYGIARIYELEKQENLALPLAQDALRVYKRLQHRDLAKILEFVARLENKIRVEE